MTQLATIEGRLGRVGVVHNARLVTNRRSPVRQKLDQLRATHDHGAVDELVLIEAAFLETRRAYINLPARLDEVRHQLSQRREPLLVDVVCVAFLAEADALGTQKYDRLPVRSHRGVRHDKSNRRLIRIVFCISKTHTETLGHGSFLLSMRYCG